MSTGRFAPGEIVRDVVTDFEGAVIARTEWLNGCVRYGVQSRKLKNEAPVDTQWFDAQQLESRDEFIPGWQPQAAKAVRAVTGGPHPDPRSPVA